MEQGSLDLIDLGRMAYAEALAVQRDTHRRVHARGVPSTLLLVEHDPVITLGARREASEAHVLASPERLADLGINVQPSDRGGDITYHGPGQLVAYPILRLADFGLSLGGYMRFLEAVVIETVAAWGVDAKRLEGTPGVWVNPPSETGGSWGPSKLCAMGVRVRRGVTMHGLALNVSTDLSHFETIIPCGLPGRRVTSLKRLLGRACPAMAQVKTVLERVTGERLGGLRRDRSPLPSGHP